MNEGWRKLIEWWRPRLIPMILVLLAFSLGGFALYYFGVVPRDFMNVALAVFVILAVGVFLDSFLQSFIDFGKVSDKVSKMSKWKARLIFIAVSLGYMLGLFALAFLVACFFRVEPFVLYPLCIGIESPPMAKLLKAFKIEKKFLLSLTLFIMLILTLSVLILSIFSKS
jgi:hypothetical protein